MADKANDDKKEEEDEFMSNEEDNEDTKLNHSPSKKSTIQGELLGSTRQKRLSK